MRRPKSTHSPTTKGKASSPIQGLTLNGISQIIERISLEPLKVAELPWIEGMLCISVEEAGLPNPGVSQCKELYEVIIVHLTALTIH